ncbi:UPF0481 protein At3g47200-like [Telopea speciosissima]|uniref:UPF0481 protein At3g47200-like n=1 Tax=Telopea speciosissima TaxID=54955 RepID=UPI001CC491F4|nr:UPF0481 protein At3g47200-like [Telopea speciosissima]
MVSMNERASISIERSEKRKVIMENPNEASRGSSSTAPAIIADERERSTVVMERPPKWLLPILVELETHQPETKEHIHKVPSFLHGIEKHKGCFDPMIVSIGPYHHGKKELEEVEKLKASIAKEFIDKDIDKLDWFEEVARNARLCYDADDDDDSNNNNNDDDKFTRMMFLDGCFILHIIWCLEKNKLNETKLRTHQLAFVLGDLFLLENQLPFLVLQALMDFKGSISDWEGCIQKFVTNCRLNLDGASHLTSFKINDRHPHLLHLLHKVLAAGGEKIEFRKMRHTFRSAIELKTGGIEFKKSESGRLKDVKLDVHRCYADLFLPQLVIDDLAKAKLLNLVAYEACPNGPSDDSIVTSYICFLDALIDHAEDVKKLRSQQILINLLGSDQEVADLFNELAMKLVPSPSKYTTVMDQIEDCYTSKRFKWAREIRSTHFSSPLTAIASIIAAVIIILTFAQAYFAVFPRGGGGSDENRRTPKSSRKIHYS